MIPRTLVRTWGTRATVEMTNLLYELPTHHTRGWRQPALPKNEAATDTSKLFVCGGESFAWEKYRERRTTRRAWDRFEPCRRHWLWPASCSSRRLASSWPRQPRKPRTRISKRRGRRSTPWSPLWVGRDG